MRAIASLGGGFLSLVLIAGHGGGSGEPALPPASSAEGLYRGASGGRTVIGLVLDDGTYYFLYSLVDNPDVIAGGLHGSSVASAGAFSTGNARDFNLEGHGVLSATVSAEYVARRSIGGTVSYSAGGSTVFSVAYDSAYEAPPSLAALAGAFAGEVARPAGASPGFIFGAAPDGLPRPGGFWGSAKKATVTVSPTGAVSGAGTGGCTVSGSASPRARGNVFDIVLAVGDAPCPLANQTLSGIMFFDVAANRLYAAAPNAARTEGILFVGARQESRARGEIWERTYMAGWK